MFFNDVWARWSVASHVNETVSWLRTSEPTETPYPCHAPEGVLLFTTKAQSERGGYQGGDIDGSWRKDALCVLLGKGSSFASFLFPLQRCVGPSMSPCPQGLWLTTWRGRMPLFFAMSPRRDGRTACWLCAGSSQAPTPRRP